MSGMWLSALGLYFGLLRPSLLSADVRYMGAGRQGNGRVPMKHHECSALIAVSHERVFAFIDDHKRLLSHMNTPSWRTGSSSMTTTYDDVRGRQVGSHIRVNGRVFGLALCVHDVVSEREPPTRKVWETVGSPRLFVIGTYQMGFETVPREGGTFLRVFIDYALPATWPSRWLGRLFSGYYAQWCTQSMVDDTASHCVSLLLEPSPDVGMRSATEAAAPASPASTATSEA